MKMKKFICVLLLGALCALAWTTRIANDAKQEKAYAGLLETAQLLTDDGLYQRALESYADALAMKDTPQLREKQLAAGRLALDDGVTSRTKYVQLLESACAAYPKETKFWKLALEECLALEDYKTGYRLAQKLPEAAAAEPEIRKTALKIAYTFSAGSQLYSAVRCAPSGYAAVCSMEQWGVRKPDGDELYAAEYRYAGPVDEAQDVLLCTEDDSRIVDQKKVVQARVRAQFTQANAYGSGMLPVCADEKWSYYDCEAGALVPGSYQAASSYQSGVAAVCKNGFWELIGLDGEAVCQTQFRDVKLFGNGQYCNQKRMTASETGAEYALYDAKGKRVGDFSAREMDVYMGGAVAFADGTGKWGFASEKGKILIEPAYEEAKSFSNGLAAVKKNGLWGFVNEAGEMVIEPQFAHAGYFSKDGVCYVGDSEDTFYMISLRFAGGL